MTVLDCHAHALPHWVHTAFLDWLAESGSLAEGPHALWCAPALGDVDLHLAALAEHDVDAAVLTHSSNAGSAMHCAAARQSPPRGGAETIATVNDELRDRAKASGDRLLATRWIDPRLPASAEAELERAVTDGGVPAVSTHTAFLDADQRLRFLDDPEFEPVLRAAEATGVTVFVHASAKLALASQPPLPGLAGACLTGGLSMLVEDTLCIARLVLAGSFERYPALRLVFGQLGGVLPVAMGRFDVVHEVLSGADDDAGKAPGLLRRVRDHTGEVYVDTRSMDTAALHCALEAFGPERLVFGSDYPVTQAWLGRGQGLATIRAAGLASLEREAIESGNARQLLAMEHPKELA
jgi:predicted TIM-barrel fold metal-dependent hydrolase